MDCQLEAGRWLYVAGANGVGKTSLLRMVCGLASIEAGDVLWNGLSIHAQREAFRQDLCYLGHLNALQESMTVDENLAFITALGGFTPDKAEAQAVLTRFG
ncbi:ATP-binding cassette domain-containing protein, partial [Rhodoferax sp.]|uniref:ABC transporter ATP-binding protein n=1 Tax=Rhodoferax sp. TaxID=50421 RepID=UPI0027330A9B